MADTKDSNPKDAIGSMKATTRFNPSPAQYEQGLAHLDGACKYAGHNWRIAGVKASVYIEAIDRHNKKFKEGEDRDPDSPGGMVHHLGNIMACAAIMLDAIAVGKLIDDRPPSLSAGWMDGYHERAKAIIEHYGDEALPPYKIGDE